MGVLKKGAICPSCEMGKLGLTKKDLEFTYKNRKTQIKNQDLFKCDLCDYEALSRDDTKRVDKLLTDFRRSVDGLLTSDQLQRIRKSLDCNKKKMARLLSVDAKTVGRYENGVLTQSAPVDKLYRIFAVYPKATRVICSDEMFFNVKELECIYKPISRLGPKFTCKADDYFRLKVKENACAA